MTVSLAAYTPGDLALSFLAAAALTVIGTGVVRRYALARSILDVPNDRSSHSVPTPRGGGLAIALVLLGGAALALAAHLIDVRLGVAFLGGGAVIAAIGWLDDHAGVPAPCRAAAHLVAAMWCIAWLGGVPTLAVGMRIYTLGIAGSVIAVLAMVWCINFYNFMDGIDGIAALNGLVVAGAGALLLHRTGHAPVALLSTLVAGACAGFLPWNWPPARIFMGDVGSGLLGFAFAFLAIASERGGGPPASIWLLLLGVFIVDATLTLARRVLHGDRWYDAHRRHAYQRLVQAGRSHLAVTASVALLDLGLACAALFALSDGRRVVPTMAVASLALLLAYGWVERIRPMYASRED
jgi:Fuc2NAc and GlcNAc transferase